MKLTQSALKLLLTLNGNTRLPQYEVEIFADNKLMNIYLSELHKVYHTYTTCKNNEDRARITYWYAKCVIKCRWIEAESFILPDPENAYYYARDVIKGRWIEAESVIVTNANIAYYYAINVIKGRWSEAEAVIAADAGNSYWYAKHVLKARFPEAESVIAKDKCYWKLYSEHFDI
jgi:hypothetical protein